jgi:hypothetical protein
MLGACGTYLGPVSPSRAASALASPRRPVGEARRPGPRRCLAGEIPSSFLETASRRAAGDFAWGTRFGSVVRWVFVVQRELR